VRIIFGGRVVTTAAALAAAFAKATPADLPRKTSNWVSGMRRLGASASMAAVLLGMGFASPASAASPPTITKTFTPSTILPGGTSNVVLTFNNPNATPLTGVAVTDSLPAGVTAIGGSIATSCPPAAVTTFTPTAVSFSGGTLPAGTCTFSFNVTAAATGAYVNTTSTVTSVEAVPSGTATATLTVALLAPTITKSFTPSTILAGGTSKVVLTINNPNVSGLTNVSVTDTFPAGVTAVSGSIAESCVVGTTFFSPASVSFSNVTFAAGATCIFSFDVTAPASGNYVNTTSTVTSVEAPPGTPASATLIVNAGTGTALTSSLNPSETGKAVTFTATITSGAGPPSGTVTFKDGATILGTATLSAGVAAFTTSSLTTGNHNITASYAGGPGFAASVSAVLIQTVNIPADSLKLRSLQVLVTPMVAQQSGQAISGAVDSAISEAFGGGGALVSPSGNGVRFNFAADPEVRAADGAPRASDPFSSVTGSFAGGRRPGSPPQTDAASAPRVDDAFDALAYAGATKALPPRMIEAREWYGWAEVRGATLDRWGSLLTTPGATLLYGNQINMLAGLTRKFTPDFLIGVLGGWETFDYRSDALSGRLKGDGWTVGSYLGWKLTRDVRFDAAIAYSGIGYDGTAGTAAGTFAGKRLLVTSGLTGTYMAYGMQIEPSARLYALWERESAYSDTLGTLQSARDFSAGRASGGIKLSYPMMLSSTTSLAPYAGLYGDYYFNSDSASAVAAGAIPVPLILDGWSARAIGGLAARFSNGAQLAVGGEHSGIGGNVAIWTYRARASVPFGPQ